MQLQQVFQRQADTLCQNSILTFTNTITPGVFYQWNFGAGGGFVMGAIGTQTTSYTSPGTYTVKVVAFFPGGCSDTARTVVNILPAPTANFTYTPTIGCTSLNNVLFTDASVGAVSYNWFKLRNWKIWGIRNGLFLSLRLRLGKLWRLRDHPQCNGKTSKVNKFSTESANSPSVSPTANKNSNNPNVNKNFPSSKQRSSNKSHSKFYYVSGSPNK